MKKNLLLIVSLVFALTSCVNEELVVSPKGQQSKLSSSPTKASTYSGPGGGSITWITFTNGHYITSFGGGIDFGTSFPHPVTGGDGQLVTIPYGAVFTGGDAILDVQGYHLVVVLQNPKKYGSGELFFSEESEPFSYKINGVTYSNTFFEFDVETDDASGIPNPISSGIVVTDYTSPTNMSIVPEDYTVNASAPPTNLMELGILTLNGISYDLYGYSPLSTNGSIVKIISESSSVTVSASSSLTYHRSDASHFLIQGTLVTSAGTFSVNTTIDDGI